MTVKELIEQLSKYDNDKEVAYYGDTGNIDFVEKIIELTDNYKDTIILY